MLSIAPNLIGVPQEKQTGTKPDSFFFITASPIFPLTAPTPVGLGRPALDMVADREPPGVGAALADGLKAFMAGAAGAAWVIGGAGVDDGWPGVHTPGFGAEIKHYKFDTSDIKTRQLD